MKYNSTRNHAVSVDSAQAILTGISEDGGLFVPSSFTSVPAAQISEMAEMDYCRRAQLILSLFLTDFTEDQVRQCVTRAYSESKFAYQDIARLHTISGRNYLELWHGPTCAFKDMALQLLPQLLTTSVMLNHAEDEIVILVATSGDTGKAALEGFKDVAGTRILVYYPEDGVSKMQKRQMQTQEGGNVDVCAIYGNFDDAQTGVKQIFTSKQAKEKLQAGGFAFSSANSINWGRLVPQIVYYFSAYADMVKNKLVSCGDQVNFCVPTGNFGNILAGFYAKQMGLPVHKFICASNQNHILTDFIRTGVYDKNRSFYQTLSPSMDILISSNLERLLYFLSGNDSAYISGLFQDLASTGQYRVTPEILSGLQQNFYGGFCDDDQTVKQIAKVFKQDGYLMDSHTAVADYVYENYKRETGDKTPCVIVSTASPYKFCSSVLQAIDPGFNAAGDEFEMMEQIHKISGLEVPKQLSDLRDKALRFDKTINQDQMEQQIYNVLGISAGKA